MTITCPLCESSNIELKDRIRTDDLIALYRRLLGTEIASELKAVRDIGYYHCLDSDLYFFSPPLTGSDLFYENLQRFSWYYMDEKNEYQYAKQLIKETDSVLEIGCGKGAFAKMIAVKSYVGLEFNKKAIAAATADGIKVRNESIERHSAEHIGAYDVVCAFQVMEHISDVRAFLKSCVACLKPGGLLLLSVPGLDSFSRHIPNFILDMPPHHVTRWTDRALASVAASFPLEVVSIWHEPLQPIHRSYYAQTFYSHSFSNMLHRKQRLIDRGIVQKIVSGMGRVIGGLFAKSLSEPAFMPRGISVTAVYRKLP